MKKPTLMITAFVSSIAMGACDLTSPPGIPPRIDGHYALMPRGGPAQGEFVAGSLTLGSPATDDQITTPAGLKPRSCVHEIPSGSHVDATGVVTPPSGTKYQIPPCVTAQYAAVLTVSHQSSTDNSPSEAISSNGEYVWDGQLLVLKGSDGTEWMSGTVEGAELRLSDAQGTYIFARSN